MAYPMVLFLGVIGIMVYFNKSLAPVIESAVPKSNWTGSLASLDTLSDVIANNIIVIGLGLVFLVAIIIWTLPRWTGVVRLRFDEIPPWSMYRMIEGTGFMLSASALIQAGELGRAACRE